MALDGFRCCLLYTGYFKLVQEQNAVVRPEVINGANTPLISVSITRPGQEAAPPLTFPACWSYGRITVCVHT